MLTYVQIYCCNKFFSYDNFDWFYFWFNLDFSSNMDIHKTTLAILCRVCWRAAESKKGYVTIKNVLEYSNILYCHYSVDIDLESDMIYPNVLLCGSCKRKVDKLKEKTEPSNLDACKFEAQRDLHCLICEKNVSQKRSVTAHLKYFDGASLLINVLLK